MRRKSEMETRVASLLATILWGVLAVGCARTPPKAREPGQPQQVVFMMRGPCYGTCPVYELVIHADRTAVFDGFGHVKTTGHRVWKLSWRQMAALHKAFATANFAELRSRYRDAKHTCYPSVFIVYANAGFEKYVLHSLADPSAPHRLLVLEQEIDRIVEIDRWIGTPEERRVLADRGR